MGGGRGTPVAAVGLAAALGAVVVGLSGCGPDRSAPPSATVPVESTTTTLDLRAEVEAAYLRSWDVYATAMRTLDPSGLDQAFTGEALDLKEREVRELRAAGTPVRIDYTHNPRTEFQSAVAVVRDDVVNHSVLLRPDGTPAEPDPDHVDAFRAELVKEGRRWLVSKFEQG